MATIDFNKPFDSSKLVIGTLKKLDQGGVMNIQYEGNPIVVRTPALKAPYGVSLPYSQRTKNGGGVPDAAPAKGDSNKCSIEVSLDTNEHPKMHAWLVAFQEACINYIQTHGTAIFGSDGLNMKKSALAEKLAELAAGTTKIYRLVKTSDDGYPPKVSIKFPANSDMVKIVNRKNKPLKTTDVGRGDTVNVLFGISGLFVNGLMATIQTQARAICSHGSAGVSMKDIFADVMDPDADDDDDAKVSPSAKRAKRSRDEDSGYDGGALFEDGGDDA